MADISILARLVNGYLRNVDLTTNTPVVLSIKVGGGTNTELTKTILDNLIAHLSDTNNPHNVTKAQVGLANVDNVQQLPMSYLDTDGNLAANSDTKVASQKATKTYVDTAVAAASGSQVKISATDTTSEYLDASLSVDVGTNSTNALEKSIQNPGANETLRIRFDQSKVDHGSLAGLGDDDHTIYLKADGTRALTGDQSAGGFKITNLADPSANGDAVTLSYLNARIAGIKPKASVRVASRGNVAIATALENVELS